MNSLIDRLSARAVKSERNTAGFPSSKELPHAAIRRMGVVGLGRMGEAFAENLLSAGYRIVAYDPDKRRTQPLQLEGAHAAFRRSFSARNFSKVVLLATALGISACSAPGSQLAMDASCHPDAASSADAASCHEVASAVRWDPNESAIPRQGAYYDP